METLLRPWCWDLIEGCFPSSDRFEERLRAMRRDDLLAFAAHAWAASQSIRAPSTGARIEPEGILLSEDGQEELNEFIVSLGRAAWARARGAGDDVLNDFYTLRCEVDGARQAGGEHPRGWRPHIVQPYLGARYVYDERFGDAFHEDFEALVAREEATRAQ